MPCKQCYLKLAFLGALLALATACSTVTSYTQPVTDFATATSSAEAAVVALDKAVTDDYEAYLIGEINAGKLLAEAEDCELTSTRCHLVAKNTDGEPELLPPDPLLGNVVTLMQGISAYASGLNSLVTADTAAAVAESVNSTLGSIENLATTVNSQAGSNVADYTTPAGKALNWILGQYIAKLQIDGLRQATSSAAPVIARAVKLFEAASENAQDLAKVRPLGQFDAAWETYESSESETDLKKAIAKAAAYDKVLQNPVSSVFSALETAHAALTDSLNNDGGSVVDVIVKIEAFTAQALTVATIYRELAAADNN